MQAKKRYLWVLGLTLVSALITIILWGNVSQNGEEVGKSPYYRSYLDEPDFRYEEDPHISARHRRDTSRRVNVNHECRMETCFDFSLCRDGFRVYVYPIKERVSEKYTEILTAIKESRYYTSDPTQACVFVLSIDTLDRDRLSTEFVKDVQAKLEKLEHWRGGLNHIIFNLYSGTWPEYNETEFNFNIGKAILAKASLSETHYRPGFDISLPLFHKQLEAKGGEKGHLISNNVPPTKRYTIVFKGKRYLVGIGSETRDSLYHIHNGEDIIMLTTCKHGRDWKRNEDERCAVDNAEYEKFDYKVLLHNATFCLVPRGRRLGSYRFLEALQAACIPVLLSNGWVLPFSEVIDWNKAAIWGDERLLLQIPSIVRSVSHSDILLFRQQTQLLWDSYFSSIQKIVHTSLEIVRERIEPWVARSAFMWNSVPSALVVHPEYSQSLSDFPFYKLSQGQEPGDRFTAVVYATSPVLMYSSPLNKLVRHLSKSKYLDKILVLWHAEGLPPSEHRLSINQRVPITFKQIKSINERMFPHHEIATEAVLSLDEDALLLTDEMDFAFSVWRDFPDRIVGYPARNHFWDDIHSRWGYTSKWTNDYSIVLTGAAFIHRYYLYLYKTDISPVALQLVHQANTCEDILINFLVAHVTKLPPIKVSQRKAYKDIRRDQHIMQQASRFAQRQSCINDFVTTLGYMPLVRSNLRLDPILFKDAVSISRKKYRQIESV